MKVLLDTNILLSVFELSVDFLVQLEEEYGEGCYFTIPHVVEELRKNRSKEAVMALQLMKSIPVHDYTSDKPTDDAILDYAEANNCIIATQDAELRQKAKSKHLKTIGIRQKKYIN